MIRCFAADTVCLREEKEFQRWYEIMPEERKEKVDRLKDEEEKRRSLSAGAVLLKAYEAMMEADDDSEEGALTEISLETVDLPRGIRLPEITYLSNGKPVFKESTIHFNLSHSGMKVFCVMGTEVCGCDVQKVQTVKENLMKRFLHPEEICQIMEKPEPEERARIFTCIWAMKESYVKMTGEGMKRDFRSFIADPENKTITAGEETIKAEFREEDGYIYCLCCSDSSEKMTESTL